MKKDIKKAVVCAVILLFALIALGGIVVERYSVEVDTEKNMDRAQAEQVASKLVIPEKSTPLSISEAETEEVSQVNAVAVVARYSTIEMTEEERYELASIIYFESATESSQGQQAVAEVVFNRVIHDGFPSTVHDVLHEGEGTHVPQFSTIGLIGTAEPLQQQYEAIDAALHGESILPLDVVFFAREPENDRLWGYIGGHCFCREYIWE